MDGGSRSTVTAIATRINLRPDAGLAFAAWQGALIRSIGAAAGFVSVEIVPAFAGAADWQIVQRFRSPERLADWHASAARAALFADLAALRDPARPDVEDEAAPDFHALSCVTEVITTVVDPGRDQDYCGWAEAVQAAQAAFPGYRGTLVQAPLSAGIPYWTTLVRFASPAELDAWLGSAERRQKLCGVDPRHWSWTSYRMATPFAGWFAARPDQPPPARWKQTALVLLVLFPVVMLELRFLSPLLSGQHRAVATFIGNAISVSLVSWPLMKFAVLAMNWWLQPAPAHRWRIEVLGVGVMAGLYALELMTFILLF